MKASREIRWAGAALALAVLGVFGGTSLRAQGEDSRCVEIHDALAKAKIPVDTVRLRDGEYELVLGPTCSEAQRLEAIRIRDELLATPIRPVVVDNVQDALVVLRFEPRNESALRVVEERYATLKARAQRGSR